MTSKEEVFRFLDELRESGACNMFEAGSYVIEAYGIDKKLAKEYVLEWMKTFKERHP